MFSALDHYLWRLVYKWTRWTHANKPKSWIVARYLGKFNKFRNGAQRFLSAFSGISPHFRPRRHRLTAAGYRHEMDTRFTAWNEVVGVPAAA